jgi:hypothetical protein
MNTKLISINISANNVIAKIKATRFPQSIAGKIWRYNDDKSKDGVAGIFKTDKNVVDLGAPDSIQDKLFLVAGVVNHQNDDPPTPYEVTVTIEQDGKILASEVPENNGFGNIGSKNIVFTYAFQIK